MGRPKAVFLVLFFHLNAGHRVCNRDVFQHCKILGSEQSPTYVSMHKTGPKTCPTGAEPRVWFDNRPLSHKSGRLWGLSHRPGNATTELLCVRAYAFFSHLSALKMRTHVRIKIARSKTRPLGPLFQSSESAAQPSGPNPQAQTCELNVFKNHQKNNHNPPPDPRHGASGHCKKREWKIYEFILYIRAALARMYK